MEGLLRVLPGTERIVEREDGAGVEWDRSTGGREGRGTGGTGDGGVGDGRGGGGRGGRRRLSECWVVHNVSWDYQRGPNIHRSNTCVPVRRSRYVGGEGRLWSGPPVCVGLCVTHDLTPRVRPWPVPTCGPTRLQ